MRKNQQKPGSSFRFERLEDRSMMAGNVTAAVVGGELTLTGDNSANYVVVHQTGNNQFQVQGLATTIKSGSHSGSSFTFKNVTGLAVDLRGGGDSLNLYNSTFSGGVGIEMGTGNDVLNLTNVKAASVGVDLNAGNDVAAFYKVTAQGIGMSAGDGRDSVVINSVNVQGIGIDMGEGDFDALTVVLSKATYAGFGDDGKNGILSRAGNKFANQEAEGFKWVV